MRVSALFYAVLATLLYLFGMWWSVPLVLALASGITFALSHFVIRRFLRAPPPPAAAVFITGTSTGFGRMFTYDLASKGLLVFAGVRKTADGEALVQGAPEAVRQLIHPVNVDVTNDEQIRNAVESVRETLAQQHRKLYAVVNNAGYGLVSPLELLSKEAIQQQFAVNVFGAIEVTRSFLPLLRDYGAGSRVVFISSVAGLVTVDMIGAYSASKYAVEAVSDAFRGELAHWGIKVSVIEPGAFKTGFQDTAKVQLSSTADDDTHSDAVHEHYRTRAKKLAEASAKAASKFPSGEPVVDTLDYCLFGKFPPARVLVGVDGLLFGPLGGFFLPDSVMDLIKRYVIPY